MRIAALYDIHGNLPALEAVLAQVEQTQVDLILVGGDVASGPMPSQTLDLLESLGDRVRFIRGNADRVLDFAGRDDATTVEPWIRSRLWVAKQLGDERLRFLAGLPVDAVLPVEGIGPVRFCHGSPGSDEETITGLTGAKRLARLLEGVEERVVCCGHTHVQFDRSVDETRIVNAGSVGAPYEARSGAYWLVAGPELAHRRTPYDLDEAVRRIRATEYPNKDRFAREIALEDPLRPERMTALIEGLPAPAPDST